MQTVLSHGATGALSPSASAPILTSKRFERQVLADQRIVSTQCAQATSSRAQYTRHWLPVFLHAPGSQGFGHP
jgi:hypothetical protein